MNLDLAIVIPFCPFLPLIHDREQSGGVGDVYEQLLLFVRMKIQELPEEDLK